MDFSLEEAMDFAVELIIASEMIGFALYIFLNCQKFYN